MWTALRKLFSLPATQPPSDKIFLRLWNKHFIGRYIQIYRHLLSKFFKKGVQRASRKGAVQIFFLTPDRNVSAGKFVKSERFLAVLRKHIIFNVKWVEVRKKSEAFRSKLYVIFFASDLYVMCDLFC